MPGIFTEAIQTMDMNNGRYRSPELFQKYVATNKLKVNSTAKYISIQSFSQLDSELKDNDIMVFRLGSRSGTIGTYFSLAKINNDWDDYFIFDNKTFSNTPILTNNVDWRSDALISFSIIPSLTETSHVNLALVSGVLEQALMLDSNSITIPATGRGNYSFDVKPNSESSISWEHHAGQVEIDSIFAGKRNNKKHIFVIEAKSGKFPGSLSKHKLMYPVLSISPYVPSDNIIVPVYIRVQDSDESIIFYIAECEEFLPNENLFINSLEVKRTCIVQLNI